MDLDVDFSEHVEGIREGLAAFVDHAHHAGLDTAVPSAPGWTVRDLVAHQGMVHRWATATLTGATVDPAAVEAEGRTSADPVSWLHEGGLALVRTLEQAPEDLEAPVFLPTGAEPAPVLGAASVPRDHDPLGRRPRRPARPAAHALPRRG